MIARILSILFMIAALQFPCGAESAREMPTGVYLSWELAHAYAKGNGLSLEQFLEQCMGQCKEKGVNVLWVTNIDASDLPGLQRICERHGIALLANACEGKVQEYYADDAAALRRNVERMAEAASPALSFWIISDEPEGRHTADLSTYLKILRESDHGRKCALVATPGMYAEIVGKVPVDMMAVDPYPFFAPGDPNGPNTPESSRAYFRSTGEGFVAACRKASVEPWLMMQSFAEVWGPYRYAEDGLLMAQAGAYLHWVTPSIPQMRWQVFEALREGAQGLVFFQLVPTMLPANGEHPCPDVPWKDVLLKEEASAGFAGLLTVKGEPTPQFDEMGRLFKRARAASRLLLGARPAALPNWFANKPETVHASAFESADGNVRFVVLVNDDFEQSVRVELADVPLMDHAGNASVRGALILAPGDGAILTIEGEEDALR